jgi:DNA-binding Xre family transcriptional regulator
MINADPLKALMIDRNITPEFLAQASGLTIHTLMSILRGKSITPSNIDALCRVLNCQPCDIIEYSPDNIKGHWVFVKE